MSGKNHSLLENLPKLILSLSEVTEGGDEEEEEEGEEEDEEEDYEEGEDEGQNDLFIFKS